MAREPGTGAPSTGVATFPQPVPPFSPIPWGSLDPKAPGEAPLGSSADAPLALDGRSPLALLLDTDGSAILYLPEVPGLDENALTVSDSATHARS